MFEKDTWLKFSPLLDEALEMDEARCSEWLARLEVDKPEAAAFIRNCLEAREKAARLGFLEGSVAHGDAGASWVGRQVGPYTISALIEQGGMGNV